MKWIWKLLVFPVWLTVVILLMLIQLASKLSAFFIGLMLLMGLGLGVYALICGKWVDAALFAGCELALLLIQTAEISVELFLEAIRNRIGQVITA